MSTQENAQHATAEQVEKVSAAHGDTDSMLASRVKTVREIAASGVTMATLADDLKTARQSNPRINAVSSTILGFALATSDVIDMTGHKFAGLKAADVATIYRGAKNVGVKAFRKGVREALTTLPEEATTADKFGVLLTVAAVAQDTVTATKSREPRPATGETGGGGGGGETGDDTAEGTASAPIDAADALSTLHAITRMIQSGTLEYSADLQNAVAQLADATNTARKFARQMNAA